MSWRQGFRLFCSDARKTLLTFFGLAPRLAQARVEERRSILRRLARVVVELRRHAYNASTPEARRRLNFLAFALERILITLIDACAYPSEAPSTEDEMEEVWRGFFAWVIFAAETPQNTTECGATTVSESGTLFTCNRSRHLPHDKLHQVTRPVPGMGDSVVFTWEEE